MNNKILWDCHMHSDFSGDSDTPMENLIQQAIQKGLQGICITEHLDHDFPANSDNTSFDLDVRSYRETLFSLREKYAGQLDIRFGVELGLQPHLKDFSEGLLLVTPFDFVIGSSHLVHGRDPYYPEYFEGREEAACYREYFESILENISAFSGMDVYGHLDYIVRYGPNKNRDYSYRKYQDVLDEILHVIIEKGLGIELNTGGYHYGLGEPNPCTEILKRYREMGGEIITIGSDAHKTEKIAFDFDKAAAVLENCGFQYYTVFQNRKPEFLKL